MEILGIAILGITIVLVAILWLRLHPLLGLLLASVTLLGLTPERVLLQRLRLEQSVPIESASGNSIALRQQLAVGESHVAEFLLAKDQSWNASQSATRVKVRLLPTQPDRATNKGLIWYGLDGVDEQAEASPVAGQWLIPIDVQLPAGYRWQRVGEELVEGFASTFRRLGIPVAMAAIIGLCLLESGAAARLVGLIMSLLGQRSTGPALTVSGFVLGVPVFFDNVFYLLLPLAKAVARQRPGTYLTAVMAIIVGATMAHSLVPPTPGPLLIAEPLGVSIGQMMLGGTIVGGIAACVGYLYGSLCHRWIHIELEPLTGREESTENKIPSVATAATHRPLPLFLAILPIAFPMFIFGAAEVLAATAEQTTAHEWTQSLHVRMIGLSNPNLVFLLTALMSIAILRRVVDAKVVSQTVSRGLADAGSIILITCAGGSFGKSLQQLELAGMLSDSFGTVTNPWGLLFLAFALTAVIRVAQGSATVAMITSVAIIVPILELVTLPFHPVYVALAIGCGSKPLPWMNDSGFWQVATMTGMTPGQTFRSFSIALTIMGLVGFSVTLLGAWLLPLI